MQLGTTENDRTFAGVFYDATYRWMARHRSCANGTCEIDARVTRWRALPKPHPSEWIVASMKTFLGATLIWVVARTESAVNPLLAGWLGMVGLIFVLHFGTFQRRPTLHSFNRRRDLCRSRRDPCRDLEL